MPATLPVGLEAAPLRTRDLEDVAVLVQLVDLRILGQIETSPADLQTILAAPDLDLEADGVVVRQGEDDVVVGFLLVRRTSGRQLLIDTYVHPSWWDEVDVDEWLLSHGVLRARQIAETVGGAGWSAVVDIVDDDIRIDVLDRLGFEEIGVHWRLEIRFERRAPDVPQPADVVLRNPSSEKDLRVMHGLIERAVVTHLQTGSEPWEQFHADRIGHATFDPRLWFLAEDDEGVPLGAVIARNEEWSRTGRINLLGVVPEARGRGIGTALLFSAFRAFHHLGVRTVEVDVDAPPESEPPEDERRSQHDPDPGTVRVIALFERAGMRPIFRRTRRRLAL